MKNYKLTTGNSVNEMKLHHNMKDSMEFDNFQNAQESYNSERNCLVQTYKSEELVDYDIDGVKESDTVRTRIEYITYDKDGNEIDSKILRQSEVFLLEE